MSSCETCGAALKVGASRCLKCGTAVPQPAGAAAPQPTAPPPHAGQMPPGQPYPPQGYPQPGQPYPAQPYPPQQPMQQPLPPPRSQVAAALLAFFLGALGIHNFYLGYSGRGLAQLLITVLTCGYGALISGVWALIEFVLILIGSLKDPYGRDLV